MIDRVLPLYPAKRAYVERLREEDHESVEHCRVVVERNKEELRNQHRTADDIEERLRELAARGKGSVIVLREEVEGMRQRMGYEEASETERLLIERVILSWLRMMYAEKAYAHERSKEQLLLVHQEYTDRR